METDKILAQCPNCSLDTYLDIPGGMQCKNCGLIETWRGIAIRSLTGKITSPFMTAVKEEK